MSPPKRIRSEIQTQDDEEDPSSNDEGLGMESLRHGGNYSPEDDRAKIHVNKQHKSNHAEPKEDESDPSDEAGRHAAEHINWRQSNTSTTTLAGRNKRGDDERESARRDNDSDEDDDVLYMTGAQYGYGDNQIRPYNEDISKPFNSTGWIGLDELVEDAETRMNIHAKYLVVMVVHVVRHDHQFQFQYRTYGGSGYGKTEKVSENVIFDRMIVVSDMKDREKGKCAVIFFHQSSVADSALSYFRGNDLIVKGSVMAIKSPIFKGSYFGDNQDMVVIEDVQPKSLIPLDTNGRSKWLLTSHPELSVSKDLEYVSTRRFVLPNVCVKMSIVNVIPACAGYMCDRCKHKSLSCFCTSKDSARNMVFSCNLTLHRDYHVMTSDTVVEYCDDFQSLRFTEFVLGNIRQQNMSIDDIQSRLRKDNKNLTQRVNQFLKPYNKNGGFIAIGWYKLGKIHDKAQTPTSAGKTVQSLSEGSSVISSVVTPHLVELIPTVRDDFDIPPRRMNLFDTDEI